MRSENNLCQSRLSIGKFIAEIVRKKESIEIIMQVSNNKSIIIKDILEGIYMVDDRCIEIKGLKDLKVEIKIDGMKYRKFYGGSYVLYQKDTTVLLRLLK